MSKSSALLGNSISFVEAAHHGGRQRPTAVLIRTSWTTGDAGAANGIAQAWHNPNNRIDSCHYVVDEVTAIRCVSDKMVAFHTNPNLSKGAISINVCHDPPSGPEPAVLYRTAYLTARLCKLYKIPVRILNPLEAERWTEHKWRSRGGILLNTVGDFPTREFFASVRFEYEGF